MSTQRKNQKLPLAAEPAYENAHLVLQVWSNGSKNVCLAYRPPVTTNHPINWSHVETITEVSQRLAAVVAFLEGNER